MKNYDQILVFDFETTGLSSLNDRIIEVGAVLLKRGADNQYMVEQTLNLLVNPGFKLSPKITEITNITDLMLETQGVSEEFAFNALINLFDQNTLLIAYNLAFDIGFLLNLFRRYINRNYLIENDILDVMAVYKDRHPYPHRLMDATQKYQINNPAAHRAVEDAKSTYLVLEAMKNELDDLDCYINVLGYNPKYGAPNTLGFKKNIRLVPQGFNGRSEIKQSS